MKSIFGFHRVSFLHQRHFDLKALEPFDISVHTDAQPHTSESSGFFLLMLHGFQSLPLLFSIPRFPHFFLLWLLFGSSLTPSNRLFQRFARLANFRLRGFSSPLLPIKVPIRPLVQKVASSGQESDQLGVQKTSRLGICPEISIPSTHVGVYPTAREQSQRSAQTAYQ